MTRSEQIQDLAEALALAQGEIAGARKDSKNPHFNSKYADLASIWDACREPLSKHGLSVVQSPRLVGEADHSWVEVETVLFHKTGQFISDVLAIPIARADAQGVGSALTYGRRYALAAMVGIAPEDDDDGNAAVGRTAGERPKSAQPKQTRPELGRETVKVLGITQRAIGDNRTKYLIQGDDRQSYTTFKKEVADEAKRAQEAGQSVVIAYKTTDWGRDIVTLVESQAAEQVPL